MVLYFRFKDKTIFLFGIIALFLSAYQLTEYMLCNNNFSYMWARIGFAVYSFLPVAFFNATLSLSNKKTMHWTYIFSFFFALLALFYPNFILEDAVCQSIYVSVKSFVFRGNILMLLSYISFYSFFIIAGMFIYLKNGSSLYKDTLKLRIGVSTIALSQLFGISFFFLYNFQRNSLQPNIFFITALLIVFLIIVINIFIIIFIKEYQKFLIYASLLLISTFLIEFILLILLWQFSYDFSSIWCRFAFLYSIACIIFAKISLNDKLESKK
jgi:hypothetical protein